jgi:hypothetical protein
MSHFSVIVIVSNATDADDAISKAEEKLEPYSCHREVAPRMVGFLSFETYYNTLNEINDFKDEGYAMINFESPDTREAEILTEELGEEIRIIDDKYARISTYNPEARWDWYELGGRFENLIPSKLFSKGVNVSRKQDIDLEGTKQIALAKALLDYEKFEEITAKFIPGPTFEEIFDGISDTLPEVTRKRAAGAQYREDPWVKEVSKMLGRTFLDVHAYFFVNDGGKDAYLENAVNGYWAPFALLSGDDEWFETGRGYLASSTDAEWNTLFAEQVEHADDDSWFLVYDLHI